MTGRVRLGGPVLLGALLAPSTSHANDMGGIAVVVAGLFVGVPAAALLLASIVTSLVVARRPQRPWHRTWARVATFGAPMLGLALPAVFLATSGTRYLDTALLFDLPATALAIASMLLGWRVWRRSRPSA